MLHDDLEDVVDRALKQLPGPSAPRTLLPRVMTAIEARHARPATRPWLSWPLVWQAASIAALVVIAVGLARLWPEAQSTLHVSTPHAVASATTFMADVASKVGAMANVTRIIWRAFVEPVVRYALVLVFVMCAACATFGAALGRVALGGVSQT